MADFTTSTTIDAPASAVWAILDDIATISAWNPGVRDSHLLGGRASGLGARRFCDLGNALGSQRVLTEEVVEYEPEQVITMRIVETNLPFFTTVDIRFDLEPHGDTTGVSVTPSYRLKYGPLGALVDRMMVRRTYRKGMEGLLRGLKRHAEAVAA